MGHDEEELRSPAASAENVVLGPTDGRKDGCGPFGGGAPEHPVGGRTYAGEPRGELWPRLEEMSDANRSTSRGVPLKISVSPMNSP